MGNLTGGKFEPTLTVNGKGHVEAKGPVIDPKAKVVEMCVWVYQRSSNGSDAIANNMQDGPAMQPRMTAMPPTKLGITKGAAPEWSLDLVDRMNNMGTFSAGSATAIAIGVFIDRDGKERIFVWSEPVELDGPGAKPAAAKRAPAKRASAKRGTAKRAPAKGAMAMRKSR